MSDFKMPTCPQCHNQLSRREWNRLIVFVRFDRRVRCDQCGERLQCDSAAQKTLKQILYVWLAGSCIFFYGTLSSYNLVPFVSGYDPLLSIIGLVIHMGCIVVVHYRAQHFTLEPAV